MNVQAAPVTAARGADSELPPGPRLPALAQGLWLMTRPVEFFAHVRRRYGRIAHIRLAGFGHVITVTEPELIKQIYLDAEGARAGEASKVMQPVLGPHSLLILDGAEHMRQRKLILPAFHGDALRAYERTMTEIARREIAQWPRDRAFSVRPRMQTITLEVILQVVFGIRDQARRDQYSHAIDRLMAVSNLIGINVNSDGKLRRFSPEPLFRRRRGAVDDLIHEDIEQRQSDPGRAATDVLSMLMEARDDEGRAMTESELRDELVTMVFAGHETTATALAWAVDLLAWHPDVLERATRAARDDDDEYIDALVTETLRIRPVVWSTGRIVQHEMDIGGWRIPPGFRLWSPFSNLGMDPDNYDDPERFDPERFVGQSPPPYVWIPFGGGIRRCVGAAFAQVEMRIVLKELLLAGRIERAARRPARQRMRAVTLAPSGGTRVRFHPSAGTARPAPQ
jgi:cytochrome P450